LPAELKESTEAERKARAEAEAILKKLYESALKGLSSRGELTIAWADNKVTFATITMFERKDVTEDIVEFLRRSNVRSVLQTLLPEFRLTVLVKDSKPVRWWVVPSGIVPPEGEDRWN